MALYAFDGTGNEDKRDTEHDSNVLWFFNAYDDPLKTQETTKDGRSVYLKGIGARAKEIVGKSVVIVANLKPRKLMGVESRGMILAVNDGEKLTLVTPAGDVDSGLKVS